MAIKPPSDIVLDVARAADPVRHLAAAERLARLASPAEPDGDRFASLLGDLDRPASASFCANRPAGGAKVPDAYKSFEGFFLQSFIQSILPKSTDATYGDGTAGEVWRSLAAQEMGDVIAEGGGIGIAERLMQQARDKAAPDANDAGSKFSLSASVAGAASFRDWASYLPYIEQRLGSSSLRELNAPAPQSAGDT
jgi:flagellar protein FlgJ